MLAYNFRYAEGINAAQAGDFGKAAELLQLAVQLAPDFAEAHANLGICLYELGQHARAVSSFNRALQLQPAVAHTHFGLGNTKLALNDPSGAIACYERAQALAPEQANAFYNCALVHFALAQYQACANCFNRTLSLTTLSAQDHFKHALALINLKQHTAALASLDQAIALEPNFAEAHFNRGYVFQDQNLQHLALPCYQKAVQLAPQAWHMYGNLIHTQMRLCHWTQLESLLAFLRQQIEAGHKVCPPFHTLSMLETIALQRRAAEIWLSDSTPFSPGPAPTWRMAKTDKIRVAYFSSDFRNHPVAYLTADLFECHDKSRFEIIALASGGNTDHSLWRNRIAAACDHFEDVSNLDANALVQRARDLNIDIAMDLTGLTQGGRIDVFIQRIAPIQAHYLGYPATSSATCMDYLIGDAMVTPPALFDKYSEKIVSMPLCFQTSDRQRPTSKRVFTRQELGLPLEGFVFCCFNNSYKIMPQMFDAWMRILQSVAHSVLFLYALDTPTQENLRREAAARGVQPERLVFGARIDLPDYLARYRVADLFLDTTPYNGGTTVNDALWAGLPVLTLRGETYASRMAASLVNALNLPELICDSLSHYEATAVDLARNSTRLGKIKQCLLDASTTASLFDTPRFARDLERAYEIMHQRHLNHLPPAPIYV